MFLMLHKTQALTPKLLKDYFFPSEHHLPFPTVTNLPSSHPSRGGGLGDPRPAAQLLLRGLV